MSKNLRIFMFKRKLPSELGTWILWFLNWTTIEGDIKTYSAKIHHMLKREMPRDDITYGDIFPTFLIYFFSHQRKNLMNTANSAHQALFEGAIQLFARIFQWKNHILNLKFSAGENTMSSSPLKNMIKKMAGGHRIANGIISPRPDYLNGPITRRLRRRCCDVTLRLSRVTDIRSENVLRVLMWL